MRAFACAVVLCLAGCGEATPFMVVEPDAGQGQPACSALADIGADCSLYQVFDVQTAPDAG